MSTPTAQGAPAPADLLAAADAVVAARTDAVLDLLHLLGLVHDDVMDRTTRRGIETAEHLTDLARRLARRAQ